MKVTTVGLDLAKQVFSVHGVDEHGKAVLKRRVSRGKLLELFARLPASLVGMEACSGAHHWARELERTRRGLTRASIKTGKEVSPATDCEAFTDDGTVQSRRRRPCLTRRHSMSASDRGTCARVFSSGPEPHRAHQQAEYRHAVRPAVDDSLRLVGTGESI